MTKRFIKKIFKRILENILSLQEKTNHLTFSSENYVISVKNQKTSHFGTKYHLTKDDNEFFLSSSASTTIYWIVLLTSKLPLSLWAEIRAQSKILKIALAGKSKGYIYAHYTDQDIWLKLSMLCYLRYPRKHRCTQFTQILLFIQFLIWNKIRQK